jgi:hypothetical protein
MLSRRIEDALQLLRGEYCEFPGLSLTPVQVQRLVDLDDRTTEAVLNALVESRFLLQRPDGRYVRVQSEPDARRVPR